MIQRKRSLYAKTIHEIIIPIKDLDSDATVGDSERHEKEQLIVGIDRELAAIDREPLNPNTETKVSVVDSARADPCICCGKK